LISVIVLFILKTMGVPRIFQFILTGVFLFAYALVSGWSASVVRSVFMAIVVLSSFCIEYETDTANSLGLAAIILFLLSPLNLFDIGFQLSFICVGVLIFVHPLIQPLTERYSKGKISTYLLQAFCISLVAWIGSWVVIAYEFDMVSPIAIIANIPIVALADLVIALSLGLVGFGIFCPWLASAFAGTLKAVFNFMLILTSWFAQIPGGYFYIHNINLAEVLIYYLVLFLGYLVLKRKILSPVQLEH
jgi:competence protein ComEC